MYHLVTQYIKPTGMAKWRNLEKKNENTHKVLATYSTCLTIPKMRITTKPHIGTLSLTVLPCVAVLFLSHKHGIKENYR